MCFILKKRQGGGEGERRSNNKEKETKNKSTDKLLEKTKKQIQSIIYNLENTKKKVTGELIQNLS